MTTPDTQSGALANRGGDGQGTTGRLGDQARDKAQQVKDKATGAFDQGRNRIADQMGSLAHALHGTTDQLRSDDRHRIAGVADGLAGRVERAADYLRTQDARAMFEDLEDAARRQPALVLGGAFALGLLATRFLKSSASGGGSSGGGRYGNH